MAAIKYEANIVGKHGAFVVKETKKVIVGSESPIKIWDIALKSMRFREKARVSCSAQFLFRELGLRYAIDADVHLELEMFVLPMTADLTTLNHVKVPKDLHTPNLMSKVSFYVLYVARQSLLYFIPILHFFFLFFLFLF